MTTNRCASWLTLAAVLLGADPLLAMAPQTVSPGFGDRVALVDQRCPTFSWGAVPGASFYELVVYALPEGSPGELELTPQTQVLGERVTGAACSFTPSGASLVFDGRYVWFLRAVLAEENGIVVDASEWSEGRYFALVAPVSFEQATSDTLRAPAGRGAGGEPAAAGWEPVHAAEEGASQAKTRSVTTAPAAVKGSSPDTVGEIYGVVGVSASPFGAGLAAANPGGGPDLVLDGSSQGVADTHVSESAIDRPSAAHQLFTISNSGPGAMTLQVDGAITGSGSGLTSLNASSLASGTVPDDRLSGSYSQALTLSNPANSFTGSGPGLTSLNASSLASGSVPDDRLSGSYSQALTLSNPANSFTGSGAGLTDVAADSLDGLQGADLLQRATYDPDGDGSVVAADSAATAVAAIDADTVDQQHAAELVPVGIVLPYAGSTAPSGWLLCNGSAVSRTTYATLFAVIGTTYGAGDGSTTFNLPDLRGRAVAGEDDMGGPAAGRLTAPGSGVDGATLGAAGGSESRTLAPAEMPGHTHSVTCRAAYDNTTLQYPGFYATWAGGNPSGPVGGATCDPVTGSAGGGASHPIVQPTLVLRYIVKH